MKTRGLLFVFSAGGLCAPLLARASGAAGYGDVWAAVLLALFVSWFGIGLAIVFLILRISLRKKSSSHLDMAFRVILGIALVLQFSWALNSAFNIWSYGKFLLFSLPDEAKYGSYFLDSFIQSILSLVLFMATIAGAGLSRKELGFFFEERKDV